MAPIHPGEILQADFLEPLGVSRQNLALGDTEASVTPTEI
jgi:plasmid maintenance system antidote protein VapI